MFISASQLKMIWLPPGNICQYTDTFLVVSVDRGDWWLLASSECRPGPLVNILQCPEYPPQIENFLAPSAKSAQTGKLPKIMTGSRSNVGMAYRNTLP